MLVRCALTFWDLYILIMISFFPDQAGDLYEKIRKNQRAVECYCKGGAFRKGKNIFQQTQQLSSGLIYL